VWRGTNSRALGSSFFDELEVVEEGAGDEVDESTPEVGVAVAAEEPAVLAGVLAMVVVAVEEAGAVALPEEAAGVTDVDDAIGVVLADEAGAAADAVGAAGPLLRELALPVEVVVAGFAKTNSLENDWRDLKLGSF